MALMYCPECGTKVSDKAVCCPYCGYRSSDNGLSTLGSSRPPARLRWNIDAVMDNFDQVFPISLQQRDSFDEVFGKAENLARVAPAFFETMKAFLPRHIKIAETNPAIQKLIDSGVYRFITDKSGEILPSIYKDNTIVAQVRLRDLILTPDLGPSIINLQTQMALAQVLSEIREVQKGIASLHRELQDDRLALAESAWRQLQQATLISDARVRDTMLLNVLSNATNAKSILQRAFTSQKNFFDERNPKGGFAKLLDKEAQNFGAEKSSEIFSTLMAITKTVQIEASAYCLLGEQRAARSSLEQFGHFIRTNKLENRDTLLTLDSYSKTSMKSFIDEFSSIQNKIASLPKETTETQRLPSSISIKQEEKP